MHILRKITLWLTSALFRFLLAITAVVITFVMLFGTPTHIKKVLKDSDIYNTFVDNVLDEAKKSTQKDPDSHNIPIDDPAIRAAAKKVFNPEFLQTTTESLLDNAYSNSSGDEKSESRVVLDLSQPKHDFAVAVGQAARDRIASLQFCTPAQLRALDPEIDLFSVPCRPLGINLDTEQAKLTSSIENSKEFLGDPKIRSGPGHPSDKFYEVNKHIQEINSKIDTIMNFSPWVLSTLVILVGVAILFLHETKRRGLRSIGFMLGETGVFLGIVSFISALFYRSASKPGGAINRALGENSFQQTISRVLTSFVQLFNSRLVWFGVVYAGLGAAILIALYLTRDKTKAKTQSDKEAAEHKPPTEDELTKPKPEKLEPKK